MSYVEYTAALVSGRRYRVAPMTTAAHFDPTHLLSFDLETTGTDPLTARIVTSALISINGRQRDDLEMLADPGIPIPEGAAKVHGISTEYAREHGRPHDEVLAETIERIRAGWRDGATLIVYNAAYDLTVLRSLDPTFTVDGPVVDPLVIDKAKDPYRKGKRQLEPVCAHWGVTLGNAHEATADALAAARVAWKLARAYPELSEVSADELMLNQATWHYESQSGLKKYFEDKGQTDRAATVNTSWPVQS
ncbi:Putative DNA polymerase III subunit epsilon [Corynebacterium glyciniphilum AJ 3170]|uniref:Putative DNA polymerase III subunit epsilon n=2 Tax=Corynebacterium TaxID=1716 RepID=X5DRC6_9CORY|nr:Putative DNA polymerase III subunit epsilon [Corynebacterium glyciniphilum AJ 3170]